MMNYYATIANYVVQEYLNDTKIYMFYKEKKQLTNSCISLPYLRRQNICIFVYTYDDTVFTLSCRISESYFSSLLIIYIFLK